MRLKVLFFATLKDRAGRSEVGLDVADGSTVGGLLDQLREQYPALAPAVPSVLVSVNREFAFPETALHEGDEVALFPPVSGGAEDLRPEYTCITVEPIDLNALVEQVTVPTTGAVCVFTGTVRGQSGPQQTSYLEYEAYTKMAEAKMRQVAAEIRERWATIQGISIVQRIGRLEVGTPTVLIAVSAGHRDQGVFEAARYGIDRLKEIVPIWKKEVGPDGTFWVEGHYRPTEADQMRMGDE